MITHISRLGRFAPLAGAGSALLTAAGYLVIGPNPDSGASPSTLRTYYAAHHAHVFVAGTLLTYAAVLYAIFGLAVWARIRAAAIHPIAAGLALIATGVATVTDLAGAGQWSTLGNVGTSRTISPGALQTLHLSVSSGVLASGAGEGLLLAVFAAAGIRAHAFPRWLAWIALVLGVLALAPTPAGTTSFLAGLLVLPWMVVAAVAMVLRPADRTPAPAYTAAGARTAHASTGS